MPKQAEEKLISPHMPSIWIRIPASRMSSEEISIGTIGEKNVAHITF